MIACQRGGGNFHTPGLAVLAKLAVVKLGSGRWVAQGLLLAWAAGTHAGVTIDGSISPAAILAGPGYQINAAHGVQSGNNLFHSFGQFGIASGQSATFNGPAGLANIIGRVTGLGPVPGLVASGINGPIISTVSGANLFLINPAGFIFGANASLSVSGSFYASSASYLKFADKTSW